MPADHDSLGDLFLRHARAIRHRWLAELAPHDLTPGHARALRIIGAEGPIRPGVLAERLRVAPRSVTDVVDALVERGLVDREPDPGDRRAVVLTLTDAGARAAEVVARARRATADAYFERLSPTDRDTLGALLRRLEGDA